MFQTNAYRYAFGLQAYPAVIKKLIYVTCRMAGGKNNWSRIAIPVSSGDSTNSAFIVRDKARNFFTENHPPATTFYGMTHSFDDLGQSVGTNMGMGVNKDFILRAVLVKNL